MYMNTKAIVIIVAIAAVIGVVAGVSLMINGDRPEPEPGPGPEPVGPAVEYVYGILGGHETPVPLHKVTGTVTIKIDKKESYAEQFHVSTSNAPSWFNIIYTSIDVGAAESVGPGKNNSLLNKTSFLKHDTVQYDGETINVEVYSKTKTISGTVVTYEYYVGSNWVVYKIVEKDGGSTNPFIVNYNLKKT